jgi:chemotaxis protein methyltransferase CheR
MAGQLSRAHRADGPTPDDLEARLFLTALEGRFGADFLGFEAAPMRAKVEACAAAFGAENVSALQGRALRDECLGADVIRMLNRSATSALTDGSHLMALRCAVLPLLRSSPWPVLWLADCTDAHLPVLLLALLQEEGLLATTRVFVTSGTEQALEELRELRLSAIDVERLQAQHRTGGGKTRLGAFIEDRDGGYTVQPALTAGVSWHVHHLATDGSFREFHAIVASRPLAEYGDALRARALRLFGDSLCPFGVLQVNDACRTRDPALAEQFAPVLGEYGIYRRLG